MIESIKLRDFRGIKTGVIEGFRKINLLVGPNNSGKSAVLEAIYLACTNSRKAALNSEDYGSTYFSVAIAEQDLLGEHPMLRVLGKHNYSLQLDDLSDYEPGKISVEQSSHKMNFPRFDLTAFGKFPNGDKPQTATFGLELKDPDEPDDRKRIAEIQERLANLMKDAEPLELKRKELGDKKKGAPAEYERDSEDERLLQEIEKEITDLDDRLAPLHAEQRTLSQRADEIEKALSERREKINRLATRLMKPHDDNAKPIEDSFDQGRLLYCWHPGLSHNFVGDSAWLVKGQTQSASRSILYDVTRIAGYLPLALVQQNLQKPDWIRNITESFSRIFDLRECAIQFLPVPENPSLLQAQIAANGQPFVPIDAFGDGARSVFKLLVALHTLVDSVSEDEPGLLIWEEPELFQNPQTLGRLLRELTRLVKPKPIQLFIASHSLETPAHFVRLARKKQTNEAEQLDENEVIVLITRLLDGELKSARFEPRVFEAWLRMHKDPRVPEGDADSPLGYELEDFSDGSQEFDRD
jgi:energy-coupling factor transporter ATP-binding protein EcfA2